MCPCKIRQTQLEDIMGDAAIARLRLAARAASPRLPGGGPPSRDYVMGTPRQADARVAVSNNFAFGGVNTSLVLRRWEG
jgi:3-oxoacyl-(acyl-carrier-protein) synthase